MKLICEPSVLQGELTVPGSKSHTIRAVAIAALADGKSHIHAPLDSEDTQAAVRTYRALGANIEQTGDGWRVQGVGGLLQAPDTVIDVGNSGTTLRIAMGSCALLREGTVTLTGDAQIQRRPVGPLIDSLNDLGAQVKSLQKNGCAPLTVQGTLSGGHTSIKAVTSQYLTSLLINAPLAAGDTDIDVLVLNEQPYITMTLNWLQRQGVRVEYEDYSRFHVPGGQCYQPVDCHIPGDFSSATFFLAAGALGENDVFVKGLDLHDTQGDRAVLDYLQQMGADVLIEKDGVRVRAKQLIGCELDLNATPDALPMMAVLGCFAKGATRLVNVPQARFKETDRIAVMKGELEKLGASVEELSDGLIIKESVLKGADVEGHDDHRVVMALAIAASAIPGSTVINGYEAVAITFPKFVDVLNGLGGKVAAAAAAES